MALSRNPYTFPAGASSMTFPDKLAAAAAETETVLAALIPEEGPARRLSEAMRYASLGGGKRLRPFFVLETAGLFGVNRRSALRTGAALECVHCYSLIHDDLPAMDDDDLRRGRPTVHRAYDEATAILAGDALLTLAFEILGHPDTHQDPGIRSELVLELARAAGKDGMAGGQMLDLFAGPPGDLQSVMTMQRLKTGALFRFACESGAILGRASPDRRRALRNYAASVGLAFQIADDILDVESTATVLGKSAGKDRARGKKTFVDLLGLEAARERAAELIEEACESLKPLGAEANILLEAARFAVTRKR
jgi:farnesyl diphosphate synthase